MLPAPYLKSELLEEPPVLASLELLLEQLLGLLLHDKQKHPVNTGPSADANITEPFPPTPPKFRLSGGRVRVLSKKANTAHYVACVDFCRSSSQTAMFKAK